MGSDYHKEHVRSQDAAKRGTIPLNHMLYVNKHELETAEAKTAVFIVENDLPLSVVDRLVPMIKSLPPKSVLEKVSLGKQKVTNVIRQGLGPYCNEQLIDILKKSPFSLMIDETTDVGIQKQLAVAVLWCGENLDMQVDLLDLRVF
jgi:hypothetical protein